MARMAQTERHALCDTALQVGQDEPTLCEGWTVKDLVVHLLVREGSPAALGIAVPRLARLTELESRRVGRGDFPVLVERLRHGPPRLSLFAAPGADRLLNTLEYFVHHEDIRRAQPSWRPRRLSDDDEKLVWSMLRGSGKRLVGHHATTIENAASGSRAELGSGPEPRLVRGLPSEVALYLFGRRDQAEVELG